ncbi:MAG: PAS domain-containing sensor histidine kinase [Alphaproteobacteria bacterium]|nr:PAS domain-containing sensor histidine kinase [Alphaproteobacteria bacterium]
MTADIAAGALPLHQALFQEQDVYAIIVTDIDGIISDWNPAAERMYGYTRDEALGNSVILLHMPGDLPALQDTIVDAIRGDGRWSGRISFRRKDGREGISDSAIFAFRDDDGQLGSFSINRDISEQVHAQSEGRETAESFRLIADNIPGHFLHIDRDLRYRFVNKGVEELYRQPSEYFIGKRVSDVLSPAVYAELAPYFQQALAGREATFEIERTSVDGVRRDYQTTCLPQFDASDQVVGVYVLSVDITDHKRAEAAANAAKDEAEIANRAKSEFLANMSHELRTPLNAINGFSEMIYAEALGPIGNVEYQKYASYIKEAGVHLLALINDLLDISKIEAGSVELTDDDINVADLLRYCVAMIRERADAEDVRILVDIDEELLPLLRADETRVRQIVLNLISNAVKFTLAGGTVTVRAWYHIDRGFVLQVADTGIGIAPENIPKALARFEQVESTLDRAYEGTGLGLPLTKSLVEHHGGSLDLHSELGVGTVVTVSLPADRALHLVA